MEATRKVFTSCALLLCLLSPSLAFSAAYRAPLRKSSPWSGPTSTHYSSNSALRVSAAMDVPMSSFEKRMRKLTLGRSGSATRDKKRKLNGPPNVTRVTTLQEYKDVVGCEKEKIVVVRFFATWCKSCKAMAPKFYRLSNTYSNVSFVEVPVTDKNTELHQGLGVPSVPFGHIYLPNAGLVEEMRISKRTFPEFEDALETYVDGSCAVAYSSIDGIAVSMSEITKQKP